MEQRPGLEPRLSDYLIPRTLDKGGKAILALLDGGTIIGVAINLIPNSHGTRLAELAMVGAVFCLVLSAAIRYQAVSRMRYHN